LCQPQILPHLRFHLFLASHAQSRCFFLCVNENDSESWKSLWLGPQAFAQATATRSEPSASHRPSDATAAHSSPESRKWSESSQGGASKSAPPSVTAPAPPSVTAPASSPTDTDGGSNATTLSSEKPDADDESVALRTWSMTRWPEPIVRIAAR